MQFIEKSSFALRSSIFHLKHKDFPIEFMLFPMIHIGESSYYEEIQRRLLKCDLILMEGVSSFWVKVFTLSYKLAGKNRNLGLVSQKDGLDLSTVRDRTMCIDISGKELHMGWMRLSHTLRFLLVMLVPVFSIYIFMFATRDKIAEHLEVDDLQSRDEILETGEFEPFNDLVLNKRDQFAIKKIKQIFEERKAEKLKVGIVYGANHMRAITKFIVSGLGFKVTKAEWIVVFDL